MLVYELDMQNYYVKNLSELNEEIRLDGLIPTHSERFVYTEPPVRVVTREFTFDRLREQRGVFIVEFIGGGLISRAVLRLGKIFLREKATVAGHVF